MKSDPLIQLALFIRLHTNFMHKFMSWVSFDALQIDQSASDFLIFVFVYVLGLGQSQLQNELRRVSCLFCKSCIYPPFQTKSSIFPTIYHCFYESSQNFQNFGIKYPSFGKISSHSAYDATSTESNGVKINGFLYPNFMQILKK